MAELLPSIDIAVSIEPREFLERMAVIGEQIGQSTVERHYDAIKNGKLDIVNFRYLGSSPHTEVGGQLIRRDDIPGRVLVEMRAHWWDPDPPTRASYCAAASELMLPLLQIYNRTYDTRYRFRLQRAVLNGNQAIISDQDSIRAVCRLSQHGISPSLRLGSLLCACA